MIVNDDPGLKAYLASNAPPQAKLRAVPGARDALALRPYPPFNAIPTGAHSAVIIPDRPALVRGNTKERPAYVWLSDENFGGCPLNYARVGLHRSGGVPRDDWRLRDSGQSARELPEAGRSPSPTASRSAGRSRSRTHNATVFKNLVFNTWYGHGLRVIDISNPMTPREIGHALPVPQGIARTYPMFKDGLIYWTDNRTGLHVAQVHGPLCR